MIRSLGKLINFQKNAIQLLQSKNRNVEARKLWGWLNTVFNKVDPERIKEVGPDRAAAEWLIRCGASVKWKDIDKWQVDYNTLPTGNFQRYKIEEIDATDSSVMYVGFPHLKNLNYLKRIKFHNCSYLNDEGLEMLDLVKDTLQHLEITSCGNVTNKGLTPLKNLKNLKYLLLFDLPEIVNREACVEDLRNSLPGCEIHFPAPEKQ
ncbi:ATP synthase subunit s, mitochondrial-like [Centruroides sculpturatus]|uniref:ATP synthase subunit s, mitochondrial-like n=1 Tax=Centruroides sculpturatus TaxID=218467 RepID=UPI000C6CCF80|nr:ATP synthase subunit s, mitochondrial-like [Centruroides sculpturatus]